MKLRFVTRAIWIYLQKHYVSKLYQGTCIAAEDPSSS